jgi:hypothetical protein
MVGGLGNSAKLSQIALRAMLTRGATGVIASSMNLVTAMRPDRNGSRRAVLSVHGTITFYWVDFDKPPLDADGDGPYSGGEIDARYRERRDSSQA